MPKLRRTTEEVVNDSFIMYVTGQMKIKKVFQKDVGKVIGITGQQVSKKLNNQAKWSLREVALICEYFGEPFVIGGGK